MHVTGLGQCSLDFLLTVDGFPKEDSKPEATDFHVEGGGPVATAIVALSRLGVSTSFIGVVAGDDAGARIIRGLKQEGVATRNIIKRKDGTSQRAVVIVNPKKGTRTVIWKRARVKMLTSAEVVKMAAAIKRSSALILDGLMEEASIRAARIALKSNVPVILGVGRLRTKTDKLIELSDHVIASERFAKDIKATPRGALKEVYLINPGLKSATVTLGSKGSITLTKGKGNFIRQKAFKVPVLDTTGAGDVFHGAYSYGVIMGWPMDKTIAFATVVSALKCKLLGGRSGIPFLPLALREMRSFYKG